MSDHTKPFENNTGYSGANYNTGFFRRLTEEFIAAPGEFARFTLIRREVRRALRILRKTCSRLRNNSAGTGKASSSKTAADAFHEWLDDNYYLLAREGEGLLTALKHASQQPCRAKDTERSPATYLLLHKLVSSIGLPDQEGFEALIGIIQEARPLTVSELEQLPLCTRAALLMTASDACNMLRKPSKGRDRVDEAERLIAIAVEGLRGVVGLDFEGLTERHSVTERILCDDPSGVYPKMDERSRGDYRKRAAEAARLEGCSEEEICRRFVRDAAAATDPVNRHVGAHMEKYDRKRNYSVRGTTALITGVLLPVAAAIVIAIIFKSPLSAILLYFPLAELLRPFVQSVMTLRTPPKSLPRIELNGVIPEEGRTVITVSTLLPAAASAKKTAAHLYHLYNTNGQGAVQICLLADLPQAEYPTTPRDTADISAMQREIRRLNKKHNNCFVLAVRPREHSATMQAYTGKERKRGAIAELIRVIRGGTCAFAAFDGDLTRLRRTKYLLALDADTGVLLDTAAELVGTALHPLVQPRMSPEGDRVERGYGILIPRIATELNSANRTAFSRAMAGVGGITPYDVQSGDFYMDFFSSAIFTGKGLIRVDAFSAVDNADFPPEQILSHDILEGCIIRTGLVSDVEMTDGFPSAMGGWLDRLHRWVRGDWQNAPFLFGKHLSLNRLDRWKLYDNLRRSITPVLCMLCLLISPLLKPDASAAVAVIAMLAPISGSLLSAVQALIHGGWITLGGKYYSRVAPRALSALTQAGYTLVMLPATALCCLDAAVRALTRLATRNKMLEWTTAAQAEKRGQGFSAVIKRMWPTIAVAVLLIVAGTGFTRLSGIIFAILIPLAIYSGRGDTGEKPQLSPGQYEQVGAYATAMWRYYEERCTAEEHFLPPDNVQESPVWRVAHRTSPTNIGLYFLCIAAAHDLGLIDDDGMLARVEQTLFTVERLEKWKGNLLNWYDTATLRPLAPKYVSTVDSGNFACCLVALRQKLCEIGGEKAESLAARAKKLQDETDLTPLYNKTRSLFHIGLDPDTGKLSPSYYDLLMSESRMTGYFAIAKRVIPKKHWGALGRILTRSGNAVGPVSWTGTMFEYFMPRLLLPAGEGTMSYEALRFCLHCQRRRSPYGGIWGISESGFYAFDSNLNYQYKAHGVPRLALKRGLGRDFVISPYSSFLVLTTDTDAAMRNLKRLERMGMTGNAGFYEAADFTPDRVSAGHRKTEKGGFSIVRSYMAHHVGMSLVACTNAMLGDIFVRRFMRDDDMSRAAELCCEKAPSAGTVFEPAKENHVPQIPGRTSAVSREFSHSNPRSPHMHLLSGAEWQLAITDSGAGISFSHGMDIHRFSDDLLRNPQGIFVMADDGSGPFSITHAPVYAADNITRETEFTQCSAIFTAKSGRIEAGMRASVHPRLPCEQRQIAVKNLTGHRLNVTVMFYFEPSLSRRADAVAHPAFSKIFLSAEKDTAAEALVITRRRRTGEAPMCLAAGLLDGAAFEYETNRNLLLGRPHGIFSLTAAARMPFSSAGKGVPDCAAAIRVHVELPAHTQRSVTLLLAAGPNRTDAVGRLIQARCEGLLSPDKAATVPFGGIEAELAANVLPDLFYPQRMSKEWAEAVRGNKSGVHALWALGISGDFPIVLLEIHNAADVCRAEPYMRLYRSLKLGGVATELVIGYREGGAYDAPVMDAIREAAHSSGCGDSLCVRGGIHPVNLMSHGSEVMTLLTAVCMHNGTRELNRAGAPPAEFKPIQIQQVQPREYVGENSAPIPIPGGVFDGGSFRVTAQPPLPWCHVLSNPAFGTLVSDLSIGYTWAVNSRENKLTPWHNDITADNRGELLLLRSAGTVWDTVWGARTEFGDGYARYNGNAGGINTCVTLRVPRRGMWKLVELTLENTGEEETDVQAAYYTEPVMGVDRRDTRHTVAHWEKGALLLNNPFSIINGTMILTAEGGADGCDCDRGSFLSGSWAGGTLSPIPDPCAAVIVRRKLPPHRKEKIRFILGFAQGGENSRAAAMRIPSLASVFIPQDRNLPAVSTPDPLLNVMATSWLPRQLLRCRIYARTGFYQCGGAWGFRDQLQDSLGALWIDPKVTRRQIIRCAAAQFIEGDVLHWWYRLPGKTLRGVRTNCSDDLVWLPYAVTVYTDFTGDHTVLDVTTRWLTGEILRIDQHDKYIHPGVTDNSDTIYEHCVRALERACTKGAHGLPLMGCGDWNDGFSAVGAQGRGESVWLAMFLAMTLRAFAPICRGRGDSELADRFEDMSGQYLEAADACFMEDRYIRAYYDDGTPIGAPTGDSECTIDSLVQSFAVLSGLPQERSAVALDTAARLLIDREHGTVKLLAPPFGQNPPTSGVQQRSPGYIAAYPPGLRENGGQYTHAAAWMAIAMLESGRADDGAELLRLLSTAQKYADGLGRIYLGEPYALAGDVSANPECPGRAGWTLYTGAAGWYYTAVLRHMLGLRPHGDRLKILPCVPSSWNHFDIDITIRKTELTIHARRGKPGLEVDGIPSEVVLLDGGKHTVTVGF